MDRDDADRGDAGRSASHIRTANDEYQIIDALKRNRVKRAQTGEVFIEGTECVKQARRAGVVFTRLIAAEGTRLSGWARDLVAGLAVGGAAALPTPPAAGPAARFITMERGLYLRLCDREDPPELLATARAAPRSLAGLARERGHGREANPVGAGNGPPPGESTSAGDRDPPDPREAASQTPFFVVFDRPGDPGNLGSVIRSAVSFGVDALVILGHGADPFDPKAIRASLGCVFHLPVYQAESFAALEAFVRVEKARRGLRLVGTDSKGARSLRDGGLTRPLMLALGNEARGLSVALKALCDEVVAIPLLGAADSLNVACAASVFMWEAARGGGGPGGREDALSSRFGRMPGLA